MYQVKMVFWVLLLSGFLCGALAHAAEQHAAVKVTELPAALGTFDFTGDDLVLATTHKGPHPRVVVELGDGETYKFIVDTGASVNVMDSAIAKRLGYQVIGATQAGPPGGPQVPMDIVKVPPARIGDGQITDAEFLLMDIQGFSRGSMDGIIGMGLFKAYLLTFDLAQGIIRITRESLSVHDQEVFAYDDNSGHIMIEIDVAGTSIPAHIDTGAMGGFMLPGETLSELPIMGEVISGQKARLVGGERDIKRAQIAGPIKLGGFVFEQPMVSFMTPPTGYGNIGGDIFSQMVMSVDQQKHLIAFRQPEEKVIKTTNKPRRLEVEFRGMGGMGELSVGLVEPGSLGESAGFMTGDRMLSLNGVDIKDWDIQDMGTLIRSKQPLRFVIERTGQPVTIEIK